MGLGVSQGTPRCTSGVLELDGCSPELGWSHKTIPGATSPRHHLHPAAWAKPQGQGDKEQGLADAVQPKSLLFKGRQLFEPLEQTLL